MLTRFDSRVSPRWCLKTSRRLRMSKNMASNFRYWTTWGSLGTRRYEYQSSGFTTPLPLRWRIWKGLCCDSASWIRYTCWMKQFSHLHPHATIDTAATFVFVFQGGRHPCQAGRPKKSCPLGLYGDICIFWIRFWSPLRLDGTSLVFKRLVLGLR